MCTPSYRTKTYTRGCKLYTLERRKMYVLEHIITMIYSQCGPSCNLIVALQWDLLHVISAHVLCHILHARSMQYVSFKTGDRFRWMLKGDAT